MEKISFELGKMFAIVEYVGFIHCDIFESLENIINDGNLNYEDFKKGMIKYLEDENIAFDLKEIEETLREKKLLIRSIDTHNQTWATSKNTPLFHAHKILEKNHDGTFIFVKDTTTNLVGKQIVNEWEYLNTAEKVVVKHIAIFTDRLYQCNFNPDIYDKEKRGK